MAAMTSLAICSQPLTVIQDVRCLHIFAGVQQISMAAEPARRTLNDARKSNQASHEAFENRTGYGSINRVMTEESEGSFLQFDDIFKSIGEFGSYQINLFFLTCVLVNIPSGLQVAGMFFITGTPKFQCVTPSVECDVDKCCNNCTRYEFIEDQFTSVATEYNLFCDKAYIAANVQAGFMAGMLVGSFIFGAVSDIFGRRFCMMLCSVLTSAFSVACVYTHSLVLFTILRFATAASLTGCFAAQYVYSLEIVGPSYRTMVSQIAVFFWAIGECGVALLAYYITKWRTLLLVISCPPALFIFLWCILPESPRWLVAQGRTDEASRILVKFSNNNSRPFDPDLLRSALDNCHRGEADEETTKPKHSPLDLLRTPRMRKRTLIFWFNWMVACLVIYGFLFYISDLAGNPYLSLVLMYGSDVIGCIVAWITIQKFGRRLPTCVFMIVGGVVCVIVLAVPKNKMQISTAVALIGRFLVSLTNTILWLYATELYPTSIRNLAVGSCSTFARVGSMAAPYVVMLSQLPGLSITLPMVIFGVLAITAGLMVLWLPESLHSNMCQTIEEVTLAKEYYGFVWMGKRVPNPFSCLRSPKLDVDLSQNVLNNQESENSLLV